MVQSFNFAGILGIFKCIKNPDLLKPWMIVKDIRDVPFEKLFREHGIRAIGFDKDNTLTRPYSNELYPEFKNAFENCIKVFGKNAMFIVSNSAGTLDDEEYKQAKLIEDSMGMQVLRHVKKKPFQDEKHLHSILNSIDSFHERKKGEKINNYDSYSKVAFVGDRLLTDVVYANMNGMKSIYVKEIITEKNDNKMAVMVRL